MTRFANPTSDEAITIVAQTRATTKAQQAEITKYLASNLFDKELYGLSGAANESGTEPSDAGTPNETGKRKRKQPQIFKFPSPVKKSKAPATVNASVGKASTESARKPGSSRKSTPAKTARKRRESSRKRKLVLAVSSESEDSEGGEGDTEGEGDEGDEESDEEYCGSTGGMSIVGKGTKQEPPGARITRSRSVSKGRPQGTPPAAPGPTRGHYSPGSATPPPPPVQAPPTNVVPAGPLVSAGMSFEVLHFILLLHAELAYNLLVLILRTSNALWTSTGCTSSYTRKRRYHLQRQLHRQWRFHHHLLLLRRHQHQPPLDLQLAQGILLVSIWIPSWLGSTSHELCLRRRLLNFLLPNTIWHSLLLRHHPPLQRHRGSHWRT